MADFGSLNLFAARHGAGAYFDGEDSHRLSILQPMPASLFWFACLRLYGPEQPAFDGTRKPADFEVLN